MDPYELFLEDRDVYEEYLQLDLNDIKTRSYVEYILNRWDHSNAQIYDMYMIDRSGDYRALKYLMGKINNVSTRSITIDWYSDDELARICMANKNYITRVLGAKRYNAMDILSMEYFQLDISEEIDLYLIRGQRLPTLSRHIVMKYPLEAYKSYKSSFIGVKFYPSTEDILRLYSIKDYDPSFNILDHVNMSLYDDDFYCGEDSMLAYAMLGLKVRDDISSYNKYHIIKYIPDRILRGDIIRDVRQYPDLINWIHKYNDGSILTAALEDPLYIQYIRPDAEYEKIRLKYNENLTRIAVEHKLHNITVVIRDPIYISDYDYITLIRSGITSIVADISEGYSDTESLIRFMEYYPIASINNIRENKFTTINMRALNYRIGIRNILRVLPVPPHNLVNYALKHCPNVVPDSIYIKYSKFIKKKRKIHNNAFSDICIEFNTEDE